MRISDWSSDVCSSDLLRDVGLVHRGREAVKMLIIARDYIDPAAVTTAKTVGGREIAVAITEPRRQLAVHEIFGNGGSHQRQAAIHERCLDHLPDTGLVARADRGQGRDRRRSEEHTSEIQSLMRI